MERETASFAGTFITHCYGYTTAAAAARRVEIPTTRRRVAYAVEVGGDVVIFLPAARIRRPGERADQIVKDAAEMYDYNHDNRGVRCSPPSPNARGASPTRSAGSCRSGARRTTRSTDAIAAPAPESGGSAVVTVSGV